MVKVGEGLPVSTSERQIVKTSSFTGKTLTLSVSVSRQESLSVVPPPRHVTIFPSPSLDIVVVKDVSR